MYFLLVCLVTICCSRSDAATTTKINYLPNGQVGGYQLIINNTVEPRVNTPLPRDRVSKIVKHTSRSGNTFTTVDEQVVGENSYLNVHRVLKQHQQQARVKYPLKNVLMVPSVRYNNGVAENIKLRFAQIGPYAALIIPVNKSKHDNSANIENSIPSEIRNSVKAYVEVQEPTAESNQKTSYAYPPSDMDRLSINSPVTLGENNQQSVTYEKDQYYKYPAAIDDSFQSSEQQGTGDITKNNEHPGFIIRVVNPTKGDNQDNGKEFFVPADAEQIVPERDDKIVANPFKHFGSSVIPSSSQFKEIYSKDEPSAYAFSGLPTAPQPGDIPSDPAENKSDEPLHSQQSEDDSQSDEISGPKKQASPHFQSSWSLLETKDPFGHDRFGRPPLGQPEFSDVSPPSGPMHFTDDKSAVNIDTNDKNFNFGSVTTPAGFSSQPTSNLGHSQASEVLASTDPHDPRFHDFQHGHLSNVGFDKAPPDNNNNNFELSEQLKLEMASPADSSDSAQKVNEFQDKYLGKLGMVSDQEQGKFVGNPDSATNEESIIGAVHSNQQFSEIQGNSPKETLGLVDAKADHDPTVFNTNSVSSVSTEKLDHFQGNLVAAENQHSFSGDSGLQFEKIQSAAGANLGQSSKAGSAVSSLDHQSYQFIGTSDEHDSRKTSSDQSDLKFGKFQIGSGQKLEQFHSAESASRVDQQTSQFLGTTTQNIETSNDQSGQQFGGFLNGNIRQNLEKIGDAGSYLGVDKESDQPQGFITKNIEQISSDGLSAAANSVKISPERLKSLIQDPALRTQFKFLSPNGQTTAVLTSNGDLAVVELPSKASLLGRQSQIVIPETTIPIPNTSTKIDDVRAIVMNSELGSFIRQQFKGLELKAEDGLVSSSFNKVHGTPSISDGATISLDGLRLFNDLGTTPVDVTPISTFDATSKAAAAVAAVAADSEHFKHFGSSGQIDTTQLSTDSVDAKNQQFDAFGGQRFSEQFSLEGTGPSAARVTAINVAENENQQPLGNINTGESSYKEQISGSNAELHNQHSQNSIIRVITKGDDLSQFLDASALRNAGIIEGDLVGNSQINYFLATPGSGPNAALLSTSNDRSSKVDIQHEPEKIQHGDIVVPKYLIPAEKVGVPINLDASGSVTPSQLLGKVFKGESGDFRPSIGLKSSSTAGSANFVNGNRQSYSGSNVGSTSNVYEQKLRGENTADENISSNLAQLNVQSTGSLFEQRENQKNEKGSSVILSDGASFPIHDSHSVKVGVPRVPGKNHLHEEITIPKYLIPLPNGRVPVVPPERSQLLQHTSGTGKHMLSNTRQYHQHPGVAVVNSHSSSTVGQHTSGLLETLNRIVSLPRRQLTASNST